MNKSNIDFFIRSVLQIICHINHESDAVVLGLYDILHYIITTCRLNAFFQY